MEGVAWIHLKYYADENKNRNPRKKSTKNP